MLELTCPECGNPLFKIKNSSDIYCACCEKQVIIERQSETSGKNSNVDTIEEEKSLPADIKLILNQKIVDLAKRLAIETDLSIINKILKNIQVGLDILKDCL